jgi:hypothetical protein
MQLWKVRNSTPKPEPLESWERCSTLWPHPKWESYGPVTFTHTSSQAALFCPYLPAVKIIANFQVILIRLVVNIDPALNKRSKNSSHFCGEEIVTFKDYFHIWGWVAQNLLIQGSKIKWLECGLQSVGFWQWPSKGHLISEFWFPCGKVQLTLSGCKNSVSRNGPSENPRPNAPLAIDPTHPQPCLWHMFSPLI